MRRLRIISCIFLFIETGYGQKNISIDQTCLNISNEWLSESLDLTKNCVGFSAPVSARAFGYLSVGLYECGVENRPAYRSLSGQLDGYQRTTWKKEEENLYWPHVYNSFGYSLVKYLYANMPPYNVKKIDALKKTLFLKYKRGVAKTLLKQSEDYANRLLMDIKLWETSDGGHEGYNKNFPTTYAPPICEKCWVVTVPGYLKALQPYWGNNRLFVKVNQGSLEKIVCPEYSEDTVSNFYKDAASLYKSYQSEDSEMETIAEYWDDAPGYSGTPTGHLFSIGIQLVKRQHLDLSKALEFYALLGIAFNDAFIICWKTKYMNNLIRPITYIQRHISTQFNTMIPTPPFPEFPSGHSFQSGAGGEVFKLFFSDTLQFIDSTNISRRDINGRPRKFKNFTDMVEEISISRYYGGIHYMNTLNLSVEYGRFLGQTTIQQISFKE